MKKRWEKLREFFSRPKVLTWSIVILTILVFVGALKALLWTIYTKDQPKFIPEEVREDVRGAIVEKIGKPLQQISNPAGTFVINAAWKSQGNMSGIEKQDDKTKNWPTYTDEETGISFKYPEGWSKNKNENVFDVRPAKDSYDYVTIYTYESINQEPDEWFLGRVDSEISEYVLQKNVKLNNIMFYVFKNNEGMEDVHYVGIKNHVVFDVTYSGVKGRENIENILATLSI